MREACAASWIRVGWEPTESNVADLFLKMLPIETRGRLLSSIFIWTQSVDPDTVEADTVRRSYLSMEVTFWTAKKSLRVRNPGRECPFCERQVVFCFWETTNVSNRLDSIIPICGNAISIKIRGSFPLDRLSCSRWYKLNGRNGNCKAAPKRWQSSVSKPGELGIGILF